MKIKERIERNEYTSETNDMIEKLIPYGETNYTCWIAKKKVFEAGNTTIEHEDNYSAQLLEE